MDEDTLESYRKAGRIHADSMEIAREMVDSGNSHLEVAEKAESFIRDEGAGLAFPINISINEEAAHRTPTHNDESIFASDDLVCVDIGVHVNGYVADGASTVDISSQNDQLVDVTNEALMNAIDMVQDGVDVKDIGSRIEKTLTDGGFQPIRNLSGHGLAQYEAHTDPSVHNVGGQSSEKLKTGDIIAIEPFGSTGDSSVRRTSNIEIFELNEARTVRGRRTRRLNEQIQENYSEFPFAQRWLGDGSVRMGMQSLVRNDVLKPHPVLAVSNGVVAQSEHTVVVQDDGCEVITQHTL